MTDPTPLDFAPTPTTTPGRALLRQWAGHENEAQVAIVVVAIEGAARTEGRQQAVREIQNHIRRYGMTGLLTEYLQRVAGLNASESPPPEQIVHCVHCHGSDCRRVAGLNASESPPPDTDAYRAGYQDGRQDGDTAHSTYPDVGYMRAFDDPPEHPEGPTAKGIMDDWRAEGLVGDASESSPNRERHV